MPFDIHQTTIPQILAQQQGLVFAVLYGSAAESDPFNDIDLALWVNRTRVPRSQELFYISNLLDLVEPLVPYPVDVRIINDAPLPFKYNVTKGTPVVINDEEFYDRFRERTWDEFLDMKHFYEQYLRELAR